MAHFLKKNCLAVQLLVTAHHHHRNFLKYFSPLSRPRQTFWRLIFDDDDVLRVHLSLVYCALTAQMGLSTLAALVGIFNLQSASYFALNVEWKF